MPTKTFVTRDGEKVSFTYRKKRSSRKQSPAQKKWTKCIKDTMKETGKIGPALLRAASRKYKSRSGCKRSRK
jgi:hypothetical protein